MKQFKQWISFVLVLCMAFSIMPLTALAATNDGANIGLEGAGTIDAPYQISSTDQFAEIQKDMDAHYVLMKDLDFTDYGEWTPLGSPAEPFTGSIDGNGKSITNISIGSKVIASEQYTALFVATSGVEFKNMVIKGLSIDFSGESVYTKTFAGALVAYNSSSEIIISNCEIDRTVNIATTSHSDDTLVYVGGLVGYTNAISIVDSQVSGNVNCLMAETYERSSAYVGGCVGYTSGGMNATNLTISGNVDYCISQGAVSGYTGGIAGYCGGTSSVHDCAYVGDVNSEVVHSSTVILEDSPSYLYTGGLFGSAGSFTISNASVDGDVSALLGYGTNRQVGGLIGTGGSGTISNTSYVGIINGTAGYSYSNAYAGGFIGVSKDVTISSSSITAQITNRGYYRGKIYTGGLIGYGGSINIIACQSDCILVSTAYDGASPTIYEGEWVGYSSALTVEDYKKLEDVRYFFSWDAENRIAYFDFDPSENPANLGSQVTEETDTSFLEKVDELVGTYVLAETKIRDDGLLLPDTLISILPVETKSGTVTANDGLTISIDGVEYAITEQLGLVLYDVGDMVTYHLYNGELVGIRDYDSNVDNPELPDAPDPEEPDEPEDEYHMVVYPYGELTIEVGETLELTCSLYNGSAQMAVWEQPQLSISHKEDTAPISYEGWEEHQGGSYVLTVKGISPGTAYLTIYDTVTEDVVEITVEVVPMNVDTISINYWDDLEEKEKTAQVKWGYSLFREDARNIENADPESFAELVKISALLCQNTYGLAMREVLTQLGAENIEIMHSGQLDLSNPAHSIAHVEFGQGNSQQTIIIVAIRGSKTIGDWITDIAGAWAFDTGTAPKEHFGFSVAKNSIKREIEAYLSENDIVTSKSKILITGHSYGAAVANLLANSLKDVFDQRNIYAYTFAAPNNIVVTSNLVLGNNIHNFRNEWDPVVRLPVALLPTEKYTVFGQQHFFTLEEIGDDSEGVLFWKNHNCTHYVNYAFGLVEHNSIDSLQIRCVQIHCPVDVTAYDENGNVIGQITDNHLNESSTSILMFPVSDQKNIFIDQNEDVQLSIVATDTGTMDVIITEYDVITGNVSAIKEYSSIGLIEGKDFYTNISNETVTADIALEVVDNEGYRLAIVNEDGTETVDISENHKHATEIQNTKEATCTETGYSGDDVCSECGTVVKKGFEISTISHDYKAVVTSPTCTANGYTTHTCSICGDSYIGDPVTKLGHYMSNPTCTEAAMCQRESCNYTEGSALGHSFTNYVSNNDATCIADGTKTATCDRCDETDTLADAGSAKGHDYVDATCIEPKICKICGTADGEALRHSYATVWSKGEGGHWHECSVCSDKADKAAHDYGTDGDTCLICEYEYAHVHELTLVPSVDATCTTSGNVAYYTCSDCENWFENASGTIVIADKTTAIISALGHDIAKANCLEATHCQRQNCDYTEGTAIGHVDENADKKCDRCSMSLETGQPGDANRPSVDNPQTGDSCSLKLWITLLILLILSFACTVICIRCGKKRNVV